MTMTHVPEQTGKGEGQQDRLRQSLARGKAVVAKATSVMRSLIDMPEPAVFSDAIVARTRGMVEGMAAQLLARQAETMGPVARDAFVEERVETLAGRLLEREDLVRHCHALAQEWHLTERLDAETGLDPVLSPLLQELIGSENPDQASAAMSAMAAQARYTQQMRRMEYDVSQLPADLFHQALNDWKTYSRAAASDSFAQAEQKLRSEFDEAAGRLSLLERIILSDEQQEQGVLRIEHAGVALFLSGLAAASGQSREMVTVYSLLRDGSCLALALKSGGLSERDVTSIMWRLNPDASPPAAIAGLSTREAREMLSVTSQKGGLA